MSGHSRSNPDSRKLESGPTVIRHLYVHVPFCHHICPYCGFYKHQPGKLANRVFVEALLTDLRSRGKTLDIIPRTIFFGGGTPTLLSPTHLDHLLSGMHNLLDLSELEEWTFEANPATFDLAKAAQLREQGVDLISLGVQSWDPAILATLGRDHSPEDAAEAFDTLRRAGFESIGIDLMFSVPGQSLAQWQQDLARTIALDPQHLSTYNLTYEEDTEFLRRHEQGELDRDEDRDASQFEQAIADLEEAGYYHYEISNFSRPGHESKHNQAYWKGADFLGIGPGAVSTIRERRWKALPDTAAWVARTIGGTSTETETESIDREARRLEALALQLRTAEGVSESIIFEGAHESTRRQLELLVADGLIERRSGGRIALTRAGKALADPIAARLA